jgi:hypothetical protein
VSCGCKVPRPSPDPRRTHVCLYCAKPIPAEAEWAVNDVTHNAYLDRIERTLAATPGAGWEDGEPPREWLYFRNLCLERERDGRERFGYAYLGRDNIQAGIEEDSDSENYNWFDVLQALKRGEEVEWDLVLTLAFYNFMAYRTRLEIKAKRRGRP